MQTLHVDLGRQWRGGQRQCLLLCARLAEGPTGVSLVSRPRSPLWEQARVERLDLHGLNPIADLDLLAVTRLLGILRRVRPVIAAAHEAHALTLLAAALRLWRRRDGPAPALVYHRRVDIPLGKSFLSAWKFARVHRFICVSHRIAEVLRRDGIAEERIAVVHSGTRGVAGAAGALADARLAPEREGEESLSVRAAVREELGIPPEAVVLGTVGGLIPHKGHAVLIDALGQLLAAGRAREVQVLVVGSGPLRASLEEQAVSRGLGPSVRFLGERSDVELLLAAMDIFVHPSLSEGLGSSIADAFSAGVPVIASRAGGIPEIVHHGETGWLVPPGDADALADTIHHALGHREMMRAMAARARLFYRAELTDEVMARRTLAVYRAVVAGAAGAATPGTAGTAGVAGG